MNEDTKQVYHNVMGDVWEIVSASSQPNEPEYDKLGRYICSLVCELVLNADDSGIGNRFSGREKQKRIAEWVEKLVQMDPDPRNNQKENT